MGNDEDRALEGFEEVDDDLLGFHVEVVAHLVLTMTMLSFSVWLTV